MSKPSLWSGNGGGLTPRLRLTPVWLSPDTPYIGGYWNLSDSVGVQWNLKELIASPNVSSKISIGSMVRWD